MLKSVLCINFGKVYITYSIYFWCKTGKRFLLVRIKNAYIYIYIHIYMIKYIYIYTYIYIYINLRVMNSRICQDRYARGGTSSGAIGTVGYGWYTFQGTVGTLFRVW